MRLIENDEAAVRLARAIADDIALYNGAIIAAGADLSEPIAEGRALYRARVAERFYPFFEDALMARALSRLDGRPQVPRSAALKPLGAPAAYESFLAPLPARNQGAGRGVLVLVSLLLVAAVAVWLMLRDG